MSIHGGTKLEAFLNDRRQKIHQPKRGRGGRGCGGNSAAPERSAEPRTRASLVRDKLREAVSPRDSFGKKFGFCSRGTVMLKRRKSVTRSIKPEIWKKSGGRCHFCGRVLRFYARVGEKGRWHIDHIVPLVRKGKDEVNNLLPICWVCNRLKWFLRGRKMRKTFQFGVIAWREYKRGSKLGREIKKMYQRRLEQNKSHRKRNLPDWYYR